MCDTTVLNPEGGFAMKTGFNLALFGAPGTGKTFAIKDIIIGSSGQGVKAHGLPGRNRYTGGMTPAMFIRIGEAYQGRRFNFIATEFNDWFKYKGMVEPLKIALEQGEIRYETKAESVGPYKFSSFFSTNYNTKIEGKFNYKVTISDPNFNAIEDRMLARLHRMTQERYRELARNQKNLALGKMKMRYADELRDHLVLVYAIQTGHELVKDKFEKKNIILREEVFDKLWKARDLIFGEIQGQVPFSARLERRALQLASTFTLPSFFSQTGNNLEITEEALTLALKFFVEEMAIRSKIEIDTKSLFEQLGISEFDQAIKRIKQIKKDVRKIKDESEKVETFDQKTGFQIKYLGQEFQKEKDYAGHEANLKKQLGNLWPKLQPESRQFLVTAEILAFALIEKKLTIDYAPMVIGYSKALEKEIGANIFEPFRKAIIKEGIGVLDDAIVNKISKLNPSLAKTLKVLRSYLKNEEELTIGSVFYILDALESKNLEELAILGKLSKFMEKKRVNINLNEFKKLLFKFRNRAAHTGVLNIQEFQTVKELIIGKPNGLIFSVVKL